MSEPREPIKLPDNGTILIPPVVYDAIMDEKQKEADRAAAEELRKPSKKKRQTSFDVFMGMLEKFAGKFAPVLHTPRDPNQPLTGRRNLWPGIDNADRSIRAQERHNKTYYIDAHGCHRRRFSNRRPGETGRQRRLRVKAQRRKTGVMEK